MLTDPKKYVPRSVNSQCTEDEVGRLKVAAGVDRLRRLGAEVIAFAQDIKTVPEGVVAPNSIVITSVDNRRADIVSNRRAVRMGARLLKVNVESSPGNEVVAVRSYNFRHNRELCVECQFSDRHYAAHATRKVAMDRSTAGIPIARTGSRRPPRNLDSWPRSTSPRVVPAPIVGSLARGNTFREPATLATRCCSRSQIADVITCCDGQT